MESQTQPPPPAQSEKYVYVYIIAAVFLILVVLGILIIKDYNRAATESPEAVTTDVTPTPALDKTQPYMSLSLDTTPITIGSEFIVTVRGFTKAQTITGGDMLIHIDPQQLEIVRIEPAHSAFELFQSKILDGSVYVTISLKEGLASAPVLADDPIVKLTLKAKQSGKSVVALVLAQDNRTTKFVTTAVKIIKPQVSMLMINSQ